MKTTVLSFIKIMIQMTKIKVYKIPNNKTNKAEII